MEDDNSVGNVKVQVSSKAVHNAVRNILANELKLEPSEIMAKVRADADKVIQEKVIAYIDGRGYNAADLKNRCDIHLKHYEDQFEKVIKAAVEAKVREIVECTLRLAVEAVIKNGEFKLGWYSDSPKLKVTAEELRNKE